MIEMIAFARAREVVLGAATGTALTLAVLLLFKMVG